MNKFGAIINGVEIHTKENINIYSPINGELIGSIPILSKIDIFNAFLAAEEAYKTWKLTTPKIRQKFLLKFAENLKFNSNYLSELIHKETGKNLKAAEEEVKRSVEYIVESVHTYIDIVDKPKEFNFNNNILMPEDINATYIRVPYGVALTISPFNFPVNLMITKIVPAILMGNTVIHKSATQGSLCGFYIADLFNRLFIRDGEYENNEYGMVKGVLNFITGKGKDIDEYLNNIPINLLSFTGSTTIGEKLASKFPLVNKQLEMGGLNSAIILKDANIKASVKEVLRGAFSFSGQRCTSIQKVLIDQSIYDAFVVEIKNQIKNYQDKNNIDVLINNQALLKVKEICLDAINLGANLLTGELDELNNNKFFDLVISPIILENITKEMKAYKEEVFGPLLCFMKYKDLNDVIEMANDSDYGLQCSIFGNDLDIISGMALNLDFGRIQINHAPSRSPDILPFIGIKKSGLNTQGIKDSLLFFSQPKGIVLKTFN